MLTKKTTTKAVNTARVSKKATKKTAQKVSPKKTSTKANKKTKLLVCAPDDKCFWTTDGRILKNLEELKLAFGTMDDEVFLHHVNEEKNDFAEWVEHVLEDARCAAELRKTTHPAKAQTVIIKHLRHYSTD